mmetsp:Transcript_13924/g.27898  ORF Transcript_13924/g.27898 Transcript_13924/m.27898 type:complete len:551 (-) Transcript_13924:2-1654(-)
MDTNNHSSNGAPLPIHQGYHADPSLQAYQNSTEYNANYVTYPNYQQYTNYSNYPPPPGDPNAPPLTGYPTPAIPQERYEYHQEHYHVDQYPHHQQHPHNSQHPHHQYAHHDLSYYPPREHTAPDTTAYQHYEVEPVPEQPHLSPPEEPQPESPKEEARSKTPDHVTTKFPAAEPEQLQESESMDGNEQPADAVQEEEEETNQNELLPEGDVFRFDDILLELENFRNVHGTATIPVNHPTFIRVMDSLIFNGVEDELDKIWENRYESLKLYKEKNGDCDVPFTDETLGLWVNDQRKLYTFQRSDPLSKSRFEKLEAIGFEWDPPMWDKRLEELIEFKREKGHCDVPINHPGLGIWVVNQRFNIHDMSKERVAALDSLGFIWNHNRKKQTNKAWDKQYNNLLDFIEVNGHPNVPATYRHSPLGTWVGKQREEYKKFMNKQSSQLNKYRIDKLNEVGFQWSLQQWKVIPWDERFEELKKFKAEHGHCKIPRNHPYFGNWPMYQRAQYKLFMAGKPAKITKEKVDKLLSMGFLKPLEQVPNDDDYYERDNGGDN